MSDYNGWKNRETWLVNVYLGDDDGLKEVIKEKEERQAVKYLEDYVDDRLYEVGEKGFVGDLLSGAVARIDFYDIVRTWKMD